MPQDITSSQMSQGNQSDQLGDAERWGSIITGSALVLMGLNQRSLRGALLAVAGGTLTYHGVAGQKSIQATVSEATGADQTMRVEKTVAIANKTPEELYQFWRNFENLPMFMKHLKSVQVLSDTRSHWVASAPADTTVEWDAEIVQDKENHLIAWASVEDADVDNSGFVRFTQLPYERGTEVKVVLEYSPPGGALTSAVAKLFGEEPKQQIGDELNRFKMLMEAGEIATTEGQTRCS